MEVEEGELVEGVWTCYYSLKIPFLTVNHLIIQHLTMHAPLFIFCSSVLIHCSMTTYFFQVLKPMMLVLCWNSF